MNRNSRCSEPASGNEADLAPTVWVDSWAGEMVVTITMPEAIAYAAGEVVRELLRACSRGGSDAEVSELAGLLVGLFDQRRFVRRASATLAAPIDA